MDPANNLADRIIERYKFHISPSAFTVALSGIDASGKGYISKLIEKELISKDYKVANINIDPWQHPIPVRLKNENSAEIFYNNAIRWDDFFEQLIFPLQKNRTIYLETKGIYTYADKFYPLVNDYKNINIILIEGILLFKKQFISYYDYKVWIDCSFETGLQRAVKRNVEKPDEEKPVHDYHTFTTPHIDCILKEINQKKKQT